MTAAKAARVSSGVRRGLAGWSIGSPTRRRIACTRRRPSSRRASRSRSSTAASPAFHRRPPPPRPASQPQRARDTALPLGRAPGEDHLGRRGHLCIRELRAVEETRGIRQLFTCRGLRSRRALRLRRQSRGDSPANAPPTAPSRIGCGRRLTAFPKGIEACEPRGASAIAAVRRPRNGPPRRAPIPRTGATLEPRRPSAGW